MIGFDGLAENLSLTQEMILANKFIQCPRPHSISKGSLSLEQFFPLPLKKIALLFQRLTLLNEINSLYTLCLTIFSIFKYPIPESPEAFLDGSTHWRPGFLQNRY